MEKIHKYIVLATKFSLRILTRAFLWFLDGTFKVMPKNYKQIYLFIAKYDDHSVPCLYLILNSKNEVLYNAAFGHVKNLCKIYHYTIETKEVMLDYELAPRNAIKYIFGDLKPKDDYFHFD